MVDFVMPRFASSTRRRSGIDVSVESVTGKGKKFLARVGLVKIRAVFYLIPRNRTGGSLRWKHEKLNRNQKGYSNDHSTSKANLPLF